MKSTVCKKCGLAGSYVAPPRCKDPECPESQPVKVYKIQEKGTVIVEKDATDLTKDEIDMLRDEALSYLKNNYPSVVRKKVIAKLVEKKQESEKEREARLEFSRIPNCTLKKFLEERDSLSYKGKLDAFNKTKELYIAEFASLYTGLLLDEKNLASMNDEKHLLAGKYGPFYEAQEKYLAKKTKVSKIQDFLMATIGIYPDKDDVDAYYASKKDKESKNKN